jgi:hypothetical protein
MTASWIGASATRPARAPPLHLCPTLQRYLAPSSRTWRAYHALCQRAQADVTGLADDVRDRPLARPARFAGGAELAQRASPPHVPLRVLLARPLPHLVLARNSRGLEFAGFKAHEMDIGACRPSVQSATVIDDQIGR